MGEKQLPRKKADSRCGHLVATIGIADKTAKRKTGGAVVNVQYALTAVGFLKSG